MYQVWTKSDSYSGFARKECADLAAAQVEIMAAIKRGEDPLLTVEVPFGVTIEIKEGKKVEAATSKTEPGESAGAAGEGEVRPGDPDPVPSLDP